MSTAGRKPLPSNVHELHGNPSKKAINKSEPKPLAVAPKPPDWLPKEARAKWDELAPELERIGVLTCVDGMAFTMLVLAWANAASAARVLKNNGSLFTKDKGKQSRKHPANQVLRDNALLIKAFASEFGLTPSARSRLVLPEVGDEDDLDNYLNS
jgi:P27 family predicted phage terminase small subunit